MSCFSKDQTSSNLQTLFSLQGKTALVTGATRGIGLATASLLGQAGARLIISSESADDCQRVAEQLTEAGMVALPMAADLADIAAVEALANRALNVFGVIDVLVCNAGRAPHLGSLQHISDADWDLTMMVNLRSVHELTRRLLPVMAHHGGGSVVLMSSIAGLRGNKALGLYGLSKAALAQMARNLAVEWGPSNVRVNAICPGIIQTEFARPLTDNPALMERRLQATPLRRAGSPNEVAALALLLATPGGAFITGQSLVVDGGTLISDGN